MVFGFQSFSTSTITTMQVERAQDVGELRPDVVRDVELHAGERHAARDDRRQHFERALPARHHDDADSRE